MMRYYRLRAQRTVGNLRMRFSRVLGPPLFFEGVVELPIDKLVSWIDPFSPRELERLGLDRFDKPVHLSQHFAALQDIDSPPESCGDLPYVRFFDWAIARGVSGRNGNERLTNGIERLRRFREMYRGIASGGCFMEPIEVMALADGRFRIRDGLHRAAIALKLGHETIPGCIVKVDRRADKLLRLLYRDWPHRTRELYQPIAHPLFRDWPTHRDDYRWELMKEAFEWEGRSVLDVGSYTGYFTRNIHGVGGRVTGVETHRRRMRIARRLNELLGVDVEYVEEDFRSVLERRRFDAVIFLSVFHWILKDEGMPGIERALALISTAAPVMFFDTPDASNPKMQTKKWNRGVRLDRETLPELILGNSSYTDWRRLGADSRGRVLFKFWRGNEAARKATGIKSDRSSAAAPSP